MQVQLVVAAAVRNLTYQKKNKNHHAIHTILKALKLIRVQATVIVMLCLFIAVAMCRPESAISVAKMGSMAKSSSK